MAIKSPWEEDPLVEEAARPSWESDPIIEDQPQAAPPEMGPSSWDVPPNVPESPSALSQLGNAARTFASTLGEQGLSTAQGAIYAMHPEAAKPRAQLESEKAAALAEPTGLDAYLKGPGFDRPSIEVQAQRSFAATEGLKAKDSAEFFANAQAELPAQYGVDPALEKTVPARIAKGLAQGAGMAAEGMIPGIGLPAMAAQGALSTYAEGIKAGKTPQDAEDSAVRSLIGLAVFGAQAKVVSAGLSAALGEGAGAVKTFLTQFAGQTAANELTGHVLSAWEAAAEAPEGKKLEAAKNAFEQFSPEGIAQSVGFGMMGAAHATADRPAEPTSNIELSEENRKLQELTGRPEAQPGSGQTRNEEKPGGGQAESIIAIQGDITKVRNEWNSRLLQAQNEVEMVRELGGSESEIQAAEKKLTDIQNERARRLGTYGDLDANSIIAGRIERGTHEWIPGEGLKKREEADPQPVPVDEEAKSVPLKAAESLLGPLAETPKGQGEKPTSDVSGGTEPIKPDGEQAAIADPAGSGANLGPGAANIEEFPPKQTVAAYNAAVDSQRAERGLEPLFSEARKLDQTTWDNSERLIESDPELPAKLVESINSGDRTTPASDEEQGVLLWRMVDLRNKRDQALERIADESIPEEERANAEMDFGLYEKQLEQTEQADRSTGTKQGRALRFRRALANTDFTFAGISGRARKAKGEPLTVEESTKIKVESEAIKKSNEALAEREKQLDHEAATKAVDEAVPPLIQEAKKEAQQEKRDSRTDSAFFSRVEKVVKWLERKASDAWKRIRAKFGRTSAGVDPTILSDLAIVGAAKIARGGMDFARWSKEMIDQLGEWVSPHLQETFAESEKFLDAAVDVKLPQAERVKGKRAAKKLDDSERQAKVAERIKARVEEGDDIKAMAPLLRSLAKQHIKNGVLDRDPLLDAVHEQVKDLIPGVTRREVMDAISGYGDFKALNKDEIETTLRDLKGQMQQVAKIEKMQGKRSPTGKPEAPDKTGIERRTPSPEERALLKEVNELKKKGGFTVTDPEKQLKSAMDAIKTRLRNEIADMDHAIATGTRITAKKGTPEYDAEAKALKAARDAKKEEYNQTFPKEPITDEQRIAQALKSVDRSIAELEADKKAGKLYPDKKGPRPTSAKLEARKAHLEALYAERDLLRSLDTERVEAAKEKKLEERLSKGAKEKEKRPIAESQRVTELNQKLSIKAFKARKLREAADLKDRMAREDFAKKKKREPLDISKDPEAVKIKAEGDTVKRDFAKRQFDWEQAKRTRVAKVLDGISEVWASSRTVMTAFDVGATFRQGAVFSFGDMLFNPARFARQQRRQYGALFSEKKFQENESRRSLRPNAQSGLYKKSGLYLADIDGKLTIREENMRSHYAEKVPGVRGSNRAYADLLNEQRADAFDAFVNAMGGADKVTDAQAKYLASAVNEMTGRGGVGDRYVGAMDFLAKFIFSPRFLISRVKLLLGQPVWNGIIRGEPVGLKARALVALQYGKTAAGVAAFLGLASQIPGVSVNVTDPTSSDFLKIKIGNTRIDPLFGLQQWAVLASRAWVHEYKDASGKKRKFDLRALAGFARSKAAPGAGRAVNLLLREDFTGKPITATGELLNAVAPISWTDVISLYKEQGPYVGTVLQILNLKGMGMQHYEPREKKARASSSSFGRLPKNW